MNSDQILAELDAQYQELIESVQLEGVSQDENSEQSGNKPIEVVRKDGLPNVSEIIRRYEQTLQTSREFYENEIKKLEDTKRKAESKYIESKKQIKKFENRLHKLSDNHQAQITALTEQKDTAIAALRKELNTTTDQFAELSTIHADCSNVLLLNQQTLQKLQQENGELRTKYESSQTEMQELQMESNAQKEAIAVKKSEIEKFKVEIIETRTAFDEQQKEFEELQTQLTECRNEINFLCTTNEELYKMNEDLIKKLEKYPQENTLLNSMVFEENDRDDEDNNNNNEDDINEAIKPPIQIVVNAEERKENTSDIDHDDDLSILDLNHSHITYDECPKLRTASTMYMMESIENSKIKEELKRLSQDANTWNHQYEAVCKEKAELLQRITQYEQTIQELKQPPMRQQSVPKEGQMTEMPSQKEIESMINIENEIKEMKKQKIENDDTLKQFMELNEANQCEIDRLNRELTTLSAKKAQHDSMYTDQMKEDMTEKDTQISQLTQTLNTIQQQNDKMKSEIANYATEREALRQDSAEVRELNGKLENAVNEYQSKSKQSELAVTRMNERYEKLSKEYMALQNEFHETKFSFNDTLSKEEEYKQQIHKLSVHIKYIMKEVEQSKAEQMNLRSNNSKQTEEISQLNHDIKQMFSDLENTRLQLLQSQQLIGTLEKQFFGQTQQLQQTRQSLRMQMNINMQNLGVMNNLKTSQRAMNQNEFTNHMDTMNKIQNLNKNIMMDGNLSNNAHHMSSVPRNPPNHVMRNSIAAPTTPPALKSRPKTAPIPNDIMNLARGKPFQTQRHGFNPNAANNREQLTALKQQRQKIESQLFKLPTKPRSLEQRKRKHSLESALHGIEAQIESIRKNKGAI